ncbi:alpha/beta fold hydrolase [Thalassobaculum sp. OXR-137]|uniref:alpha/beta fold hydrolase n=1 Tax=Thalassobaculum sp. OXR-137 TaxID=3100173 RepID=UPI002AC900E5|nr:alpha/beta fold hydrolase [Thalassobaculum sp. OXR-137]WPZ32947.1 alpha/beta fold hydrolase [Thalassobaculum sp. OXR-137]
MPAETLVLIPGLLNDAELWAKQIPMLDDLVDRIVIPDTTAHEDIRDIAAQVLAETDGKLAVAGLSMGGYVALEILRQAPGRVERLALLDTSARQDSDDQRRRRTGLIELADKGKFKGVTPRLLPMLVHKSRLEDETVTRPIFDMAARIGKDGFIRQQKAILSRDDSRDLLSGVSVPTLIVCGRDDQLTPVDLSEEMAAAVPHADLRIVEACGHLPALEKPQECGDALRGWLQA